MTDEALFERIDGVLKPLGGVVEEGEEFASPPLDVLRYIRRPTRLHWVPVLGRAQGIVAVVRQPVDLGSSADHCRSLLNRVALAVNGRFTPSFQTGTALGLTVITLTPEPIGVGDEAVLAKVVDGRTLSRVRAVPLGLFRVNLGQEAFAYALAAGPEGVFPEPLALADALGQDLRRFVPLMDW
jgi:hypothetical protein